MNDEKEQDVAQHFDPSLELHHALRVVGPHRYLLLTVFTCCFVALIVWAFLGSLPIQVLGQGLVVRSDGLFTVQASVGGYVRKVLLSSGNRFTEKQLLMEVYDPEDLVRLQAALEKVETQEQDYERLRQEIEEEGKAVRFALKERLDTARYTMSQRRAELPFLEETLRERTTLFEDGLINKNVLLDAKDRVASRRIEIEQLGAQIAETEAELAKAYRGEELEHKEQELIRIREERDILEFRRSASNIIAPQTGKVLEVLVNPGNFVKPGQTVLWAESDKGSDDGVHVLAFFPVQQGKRLKVGDRVFLELSTVDAQEHGMLEAHVEEISSYAVSVDSMGQEIHNKNLIQYLMGGHEAVVRTRLRLSPSTHTESLFNWTSGNGPDELVTSGTVCTVKGVVEGVRPIDYVFPMWRLKRVGQQ